LIEVVDSDGHVYRPEFEVRNRGVKVTHSDIGPFAKHPGVILVGIADGKGHLVVGAVGDSENEREPKGEGRQEGPRDRLRHGSGSPSPGGR
jgi:hypothetical protein